MESRNEIIKIEHLNKSFGEVRAVQDLSLSVRRGELFAFLGVNGAGKSTTISILCGQLAKDSGEVTICSKDSMNLFWYRFSKPSGWVAAKKMLGTMIRATHSRP